MSRRLKAVSIVAILTVLLLLLHSSSADDSYLPGQSEKQRKLQLRASLDQAAIDARATASIIRLPKKPQKPLLHTGNPTIDKLVNQHPVVIFSKSYCSYSAKAKALLLETYKIDPPPFVVELDLVEGGDKLQEALETITGRNTVPVSNISLLSLLFLRSLLFLQSLLSLLSLSLPWILES